jgi:hypothetical protein
MQNESDKAPIKFFVDSQNKAAIRCPKCGASRTVDTATLKDAAKQIKITCKCGMVFKGVIEFRRRYRKAVRLPGKYKDLNGPKRGAVVIKDLSMGGIGFTCDPTHKLEPGDHLEVVFQLDDAQKSEIRLLVTVRSVKGDFVGAERTDKQGYQGALGFYLM